VTTLTEQFAEAGLGRRADELLVLGIDCVRLVAEVGQPGPSPRLVVTGTRFSLDAVAIVSSGTHWLALPGGGTPVAWGYNDRGQLGNGTRAESKEPVAAKKLDDVVAIAAGARHSLALRGDGTVVAWGENERGQLGDGTRKMRNKPVAVLGLEADVHAIAAGDNVSYALRSDGSVVGWGMNVGPDHAGLAAIPDHPVAVRGLEGGIVALAAGLSTAVALTDGGDVLQWGSIRQRDRSVSFHQAPEPVVGLDARVVAIAAGNYHSLALTVDGRVLAWGNNMLGALGVDRDAVPDSGIVEVIDGDVVAIASALGASVALTRTGEILRWGHHIGGGMPILEQPTRVDIGAGTAGIVAISTEAALTADGDVHWWHTARDDGVAAPGGTSARVGDSRLGGNPDLASGTPWPQVDGRPLAFVAQLDLAELAPLGCAPPLPADGLLSLFVLPADIGFANTFALRYAPAGTQLAPAQPPAALADGDRFAALALRPARELSLPPPTASAVQRLGLSDTEFAAYTGIVTWADQPLHRVLGHPALFQTSDPRDDDAELTLLLQVDTEDTNDMDWGFDCGRLYVWIAADDLAARRFEHATMLFDLH
jgi:alpha-tubulin suppressor-like RCC1 family protein